MLGFKPGTYVSVENEGALNLRAHMEYEKHKTAVRGEMSLAKVKVFFTALGSILDYAVLVAKCAFLLHTVKRRLSYKRADIIPVLFKTVFPDSEIVRKF
jgi:hypothetical protein